MSIADILAAKKLNAAAAQKAPELLSPTPKIIPYDGVANRQQYEAEAAHATLAEPDHSEEIQIALRESGSVAEEDIEHVAATVQKNNGETRRIDGASSHTKSIESTESKEPRAVSSPNTKPARLLDLLRDYGTVEMLRESPVWRLLSLPERIQLNKEYVKQRALSGQEPQILKPAHTDTIGSIAPGLEDDVTVVNGQLVVEPKPTVHALSGSEALFIKYPSFAILRASPEYAGMSIADKTLMAREYAKQAQLLAMEANRAMREGENAMLQNEQEKALKQGAADALNGIAVKHEAFALDIQLNERQMMGVEYAKAGKSFVLTGAAGTGKTTACREIARVLIKRGDLGTHTFKTEGGERVSGPGIVFCAYTRRATANIRRALHKDPQLERELEENVVTIHRLLEYQPEFYPDPNDFTKTKMRFIPMRNADRPLDVKIIVMEEASMQGLDLEDKLYDAMRPGTIMIFVGDINQLPPVFGKSIMNYALAQLPVVELTEVYRQALDSGVIVAAHQCLRGEAPDANKDVTIIEGDAKDKHGKPVAVGQERMAKAMGSFFKKMWLDKEYDPNQDVILSPWNKQFMGTTNLNNWIAQFLGEGRDAMVYEVLTNRRKMYLAVGDRVMYEKQDGIIVRISHNAQYLGKMPQPASTALTRFGIRKMSAADALTEDFDLAGAGIGYEGINIDEVPDEERKAQASHIIDIRLDSGETETLSSVGDFSEQKFSLGYCLTVHKAQGCEWRKVYILLHKDHTLGGFLSRELIYTAMTRAREKLVIVGKKALLAKAVKYQEIQGNTLEEKIASINRGAVNIGSYPVIKPKN